jgi:hypothetical protein
MEAWRAIGRNAGGGGVDARARLVLNGQQMAGAAVIIHRQSSATSRRETVELAAMTKGRYNLFLGEDV